MSFNDEVRKAKVLLMKYVGFDNQKYLKEQTKAILERVEKFDNKLLFETTLVKAEAKTDWIEETLIEIKETLESDKLPNIGERCEYCPYREASGKKLQAIYHANK